MASLVTFVVLSVSFVRHCRATREKKVEKPPVVTSFFAIRDVLLLSLVVLFFGFPLLLGPIQAPNPPGLTHANSIALSMEVYSRDHEGKYPDGKSSTEVFQKLLDEGYVKDPSLFYIAMEGKTKPLPGQPLKPENVGWDVTTPIDTHMPSPGIGSPLPVVFSTGYKVSYLPGAAAVPLLHPYPKYKDMRTDNRDWWTKLYQAPLEPPPGIWVCYYRTGARFWPVGNGLGWIPDGNGRPWRQNNPDNLIPNFIPTDFDAQGKEYQQLTPNGILGE